MSRHYEADDEGKKFAIFEVHHNLWSGQCRYRNDEEYCWTVRIGYFPPGLPTKKMETGNRFFYIDLKGITIKSDRRFATAAAARDDFLVWYDDLFANPPTLVTSDGNPVQRLLF